MYIGRLFLNSFKNYDQAEYILSPGVNVLHGPNGAGKTNLLDAVHYLSTAKSFLVSSDSLNIKSGGDFFFLEGWISVSGEEDTPLQCAVKKGQGKVFRRNKKEYEKLSDHIGFFPVVVIAPGDQELLHGGSAERRKFVDSLISMYDKAYLSNLIRYGKLVEQRNAFLKQCQEKGVFRNDLLDIYDEQMAEPAAYIFRKRNELLEELLPLFYNTYRIVSQTDEIPEIRVKTDGNAGENVMALFAEAREKDKALLYTSVGPHKDDFEFTLSGLSLKLSSSQGQQKTFLTALKLARFHLIHEKTGKIPVLLLDDVFDKLDERRVKNLLEIISIAPFGQVLITDTGKTRIGTLLGENGTAYHELEIITNTVLDEKAV